VPALPALFFCNYATPALFPQFYKGNPSDRYGFIDYRFTLDINGVNADNCFLPAIALSNS